MRALILPTVHRAELPTPREEDGTAACPTPGERKLEHSASSAEGFHGGGWQAPVGPAGRPVLFSFLQQSPAGLASSPAEKLPSRPPPLPGVACDGRNNGCTWVR